MNLRKTATALVSIAAAMGACKKDEKKSETPPAVAPETAPETAVTPPEEAPKAAWTGEDTAKAFGDCWGAFNAKDEAKFLDCYAADVDFSYVDFAPAMALKGLDALTPVMKMWWKAFPDSQGESQLLLVNGSNFASITLMTQTNTGEGMMPPTGKKTVSFEAQFGSLNAEGKVASDHHHTDQATMAHQMGMQKSDRAPDSETAWAEKSVVIAKNDDAEKANMALVEKLGALVEKKDHEGVLALVADDLSFRYVGDKTPLTSKAGYEKGIKEWMAMVKVTNREIKSAWAAGDWVFVTSEMQVEMLVDMPMAKGSKGKQVKLAQTEFFQIADGKLKTHWVFENSMQYAVQLGLVDPSKMGGHADDKK